MSDQSTLRTESDQSQTQVSDTHEQQFRVLLCTDYLPPSDGGVEQVVQQLAQRLDEWGHEVALYTLSSSNERIELSDHSGITVFKSPRIDLTEYLGLQSAVSISALQDFGQVIAQFDPDIVHTHNRFFFTSYLGLLYTRLKPIPLVTTLHLGELAHLDGMGGIAARVFQSSAANQLVQRSDSVIGVSDAANAVGDSLGAEDLTTIPNCVDMDQFTVPKPDFDKTLLYVGRLVRNNGPHDLIRAAPEILKRHPDTQIHLVGDGNLKSDLEELVDSLSLSESVNIHGFVDDIIPFYQNADVFCRPSYSEGLPLTLLEAMATYSVPVVTPIAGAEEVISEGETGYFVDVDNPTSVATTINKMFDDPKKIGRMAEAARDYVEHHHSWTERTENIIQVYQDILIHE